MNKKSIWNLHLLDKLYYINMQDKSIDDTPVFKLEVAERDYYINDMKLSGSDTSSIYVLSRQNVKMYFNKEDAEADLEIVKFSLKTPIQ